MAQRRQTGESVVIRTLEQLKEATRVSPSGFSDAADDLLSPEAKWIFKRTLAPTKAVYDAGADAAVERYQTATAEAHGTWSAELDEASVRYEARVANDRDLYRQKLQRWAQALDGGKLLLMCEEPDGRVHVLAIEHVEGQMHHSPDLVKKVADIGLRNVENEARVAYEAECEKVTTVLGAAVRPFWDVFLAEMQSLRASLVEAEERAFVIALNSERSGKAS
jgi:hypothetical protein